MAYAAVQYRHYDLPWTIGADQEERFKRVLKGTLGAVVAFALLLSVLPVPEPDPAEIEEVPQRFARLMLERVEPPPPPPPVVQNEPEPLPEPEPEPVTETPVDEAPPPVPRPEPERVVEEPPPAPAPENRVEQARERARSAGLLPFAEQLSALRDEALLDDLAEPQATVSSAAANAAAVPERSLITSRAGVGSGGINTAALSRDTGGSALAGRTTTRVESPVEGSSASGSGAGAGGAAGGDARPSRSREEIERVFDQNKGAIYALYNRALRENPALEGKLVLRLTIAPDGSVTACEVVSSELGDAELEQKLVQRVMLFRFEAKDVAPVTTTKPIDFFPG